MAILPRRIAFRFAKPGKPIMRKQEDDMILRVWRGWTAPENADRYEELIRAEIFPGILSRNIAGLEGLELFRRPLKAEVEFMTLMRFASRDAVKAFAGPDWEISVVPLAARAVLAHFDDQATHYEQRVPQYGWR
jgi:hypothetical protein